jgi:hypothetical protein
MEKPPCAGHSSVNKARRILLLSPWIRHTRRIDGVLACICLGILRMIYGACAGSMGDFRFSWYRFVSVLGHNYLTHLSSIGPQDVASV